MRCLVASMLTLSCFAIGIGISAQQPPSRVVISQVGVVDVVASRIDSNRTVVIEGDRIVAIGDDASLPGSMPAQVVDGRGRFLVPGLWDMHVHLSSARESALLALIANGVTTVRDMGSRLVELEDWRSRVAAGSLAGPQILRAGPILNGQAFNRYQVAVSTDADGGAVVRTLHNIGVDFIKLHRQTPREAYFAVADEAKKLGLPFVGHIPITVTPIEASDAGQQTVEHIETLFEGTFAAANKGKDMAESIAAWRTSADARELLAKFAANRTSVDPTLVAQRQALSFMDSSATVDRRVQYVAASAKKETEELFGPLRAKAEQLLPELRRRLQEYFAVVGMMRDAGVNLVAGTDLASSYIYPGFSLHDELALLVETGLTPAQALRTATVNAGRLFPSLRTGTIALDQRADLVLLEANPLEDIRNTQRISAVVVAGKFFDRKGLDEMLRQASMLAQRN